MRIELDGITILDAPMNEIPFLRCTSSGLQMFPMVLHPIDEVGGINTGNESRTFAVDLPLLTGKIQDVGLDRKSVV